MRINARLESSQVKQLEAIKKSEHLTTTQVIKEALDCYFQHKGIKRKTNIQRLLASDFIGSAEGPENLSENYKSYLSDSLAEKHGTD